MCLSYFPWCPSIICRDTRKKKPPNTFRRTCPNPRRADGTDRRALKKKLSASFPVPEPYAVLGLEFRKNPPVSSMHLRL